MLINIVNFFPVILTEYDPMVHLQADHISEFRLRQHRISHASEFIRQIIRLSLILCVGALLALLATSSQQARADSADFRQFVENLRPDAERQGISRDLFDRVFETMTPDQHILDLTQKQSEFNRPIWAYIDDATSRQRIDTGRTKAQQWAQTLNQIEKRYGVDPTIILAVWGMESNFGSNAGHISTLRALATLGFAQYRGTYFRKELLAALKILQHGDVSVEAMQGSWAGAMGQTQFMPSAYQAYAVDFNHKGRRDIWDNVPDALASTANYLKAHGWIGGETWGYEVNLPKNYKFNLSGNKPFRTWVKHAFSRTDGEPMPARGSAALLLPAGRLGPAFLVTPNFAVIKTYNKSLSYALGVALLADQIGNFGALKHEWPREQTQLTVEQVKLIQNQLSRLGFDIGEIDGKYGETLSQALRIYQTRNGLLPDGYPSMQTLEKMRQSL